MHPEDIDRLLRVGEVTHRALNNQEDYPMIASLCSEEFAVKLFLLTAERHRLLTGIDKPTCFAEGMAMAAVSRADGFLKVFVNERLALHPGGVLCNMIAPADGIQKVALNTQRPSGLPDPVNDDFTTVEWKPNETHYDRFPHLVLLVREKEPRVYTVLPMVPALLCREDAAFEMARLFSVYSNIDVCLVLGTEKCIYIHKDGTYKRSQRRPSGGAVAHRSVTGPYLYSLHREKLQATLVDRPDAFQWLDEFNSEPEHFTGRDYTLAEPLISPNSDILTEVKNQVGQVVEAFLTIIGKEWDGDLSVLTESTVAWLRALDIPECVRIVGREDLQGMSAQPLHPSQYFTSPLYSTLDGVLDVMEFDLKRAGLYEYVNVLMEPVYHASHIGYLRLLAQSTRLAGEPDNETFWNRVQGQVLPAAACSPVTLVRLLVWQRIEHLYRGFFPPSDTDRGSYARAQEIQAALPLLVKVNERGPMWMWQTSEDVRVMPAVVVRLDEEGELHCEGGPAIIEPDGTRTFAIHGEEQ